MTGILLNPGPVTLSRRVRMAMLRPDLCHRESEFADLQGRLRTKLLAVYRRSTAGWAAVMLTGSGTAAVEAMLTSCVPAAGRLLVIQNGVYGERMARIARAYGIDHDIVTSRWRDPIDFGGVERALARGGFTHVALVHHETTTGRLNDVARVGALAGDRGARLLVDAVSSFGGEWIDFDGWTVDACAGTANKCLHGVPGATFVVVRRAALSERPSRTIYLDLAEHLEHQDLRTTAFTPAVPAFYALDEALDELVESGGWVARHQLFQRRMHGIRNAVLAAGARALLPESDCSCVLHAFRLPEGLSYAALHDSLKQDGFVIYGGQGQFAERFFRISAMGEISDTDLGRLHDALRRSLALPSA